MKQLISIIILLLTHQVMMGKNTVEGTIIDAANGKGIAYATVSLLSSDSVFISGKTTNDTGAFKVDTREGMSDYILHVSCVGYEALYMTLVNVQSDLRLGNLELSDSSTALEEVIVTASSAIRKADRQIIVPTRTQRKASTNGMTLLQNLQLPRLKLNPTDHSVSLIGGESVQLRINGKEATRQEVVALMPADITRVEYIDNPGVRYGNSGAVVNYVVKRRENGGNLSGDFTNSIAMWGYGEHQLSGKYNTSKSELSAIMAWSRRDVKWTRENEEVFQLSDNPIRNTEIGSPTKMKYDNLDFTLSYNYYPNANNLLSVKLTDKVNDMPNSMEDRESQLTQGNETYSIYDKNTSKTHIPAIDIYYQMNLKNQQRVYVDVVGTYLSSKSLKWFSMANDRYTNEVTSTVDGEKYSVIGEGIYEKGIKDGMITAGIKHTQVFLTNRYRGDTDQTVDMRTAETYAFGEWRSSFKGLNYTVGIGAMNTYNQQEAQLTSKLIFRPSLSLSYGLGKHWFFRYNGYMSGYAPSLGDLNDVTQTIDTYQKRKGNSSLKTVTFYTNTLSVNYSGKYFSAELFGRYSYDHKPFMESSYAEDSYVIRTMENQRGFHRLNLVSTLTITPLGEYLMIRLSPFVNRYISYGNSYTHTHTNWGMTGSVMAMYKNWALLAEMNTSEHTLWGETLTKDEKLHQIKVGYNTERWSIGIGAMNLFSKRYEIEKQNLSATAPYRQAAYSKNLNPVVFINAAFNIDFGKRLQGRNKRINNRDTDAGILSGKR